MSLYHDNTCIRRAQVVMGLSITFGNFYDYFLGCLVLQCFKMLNHCFDGCSAKTRNLIVTVVVNDEQNRKMAVLLFVRTSFSVTLNFSLTAGDFLASFSLIFSPSSSNILRVQ